MLSVILSPAQCFCKAELVFLLVLKRHVSILHPCGKTMVLKEVLEIKKEQYGSRVEKYLLFIFLNPCNCQSSYWG